MALKANREEQQATSLCKTDGHGSCKIVLKKEDVCEGASCPEINHRRLGKERSGWLVGILKAQLFNC